VRGIEGAEAKVSLALVQSYQPRGHRAYLPHTFERCGGWVVCRCC
jgi:hypothetical protein